MTKYEWESELKRNIHRLPKSEQDRALEFYNELFEDRIESGWTETQIIAEFGNPCDVADKILAEYDESAADSGDDASATRLSSVNTPYGPGDARRPDNAADAPAAEDCGQTPPTAAAPESAPPKTSGRGFFDRLLGVAVRLVKAAFRIAGFVIRWGLWVAAALVTAGGALLLLGGAAVAVLALFFIGTNGAGAAANIGVGLIAAGGGLAVVAMSARLFRLCKRLGVKVTEIIKREVA